MGNSNRDSDLIIIIIITIGMGNSNIDSDNGFTWSPHVCGDRHIASSLPCKSVVYVVIYNIYNMFSR